jgi:hypothetical protein
MTNNHWIETSRKIYAAFLALYPKEHRAEYGESMRQVFADQCRDAYQKKGTLGIILLWLRILPDLGYTALLEHVTAPSASWGLMEPVQNAPLPWKGIFMILLPGLVYLVSQVAQLTGQPWYLTVYYRAAFLLIIPVLVVWAITRRFPIWGLIPVGLLYRLLQEIGYQLIVLHPGVFSSNPLLNTILKVAKLVQSEPWILVIVFTVAILFLAWRYTRKQKPSRSFWLWLGLYLLIATLQITNEIYWQLQFMQENSYFAAITPTELWDYFSSTCTWIVYDITALLLLVFIGTLFTRRHGFFAILIPMGYILPALVVGLPPNLEYTSTPVTVLIMISFAVLAYRALLSLVAPIWMSRTSSQVGKKRIVLTAIAIALGIHAMMQFYLPIFFPEQGYYITPMWVTSVALDELKLISAIVLGVSMYQSAQPASETPAQATIEYPELSADKA